MNRYRCMYRTGGQMVMGGIRLGCVYEYKTIHAVTQAEAVDKFNDWADEAQSDCELVRVDKL